MNQHHSLDASALMAELEQKDLLIKQLSEELMRYVGQQSNVAETAGEGRDDSAAIEAPADMRQLAERNRELESLLQELPEIYQEKFATRLEPVKAELDRLRAENQRLRAEMKSLNYRLSVRDGAAADSINLPSFATYDASSSSSINRV